MVNSLKRVPGLDLVRSFAVFSVVSVHFLLNIGYYSYSMDGERMFILTAMRWFFYTCVPLFMIITGYLQHNKTIEKQYYKKMLRILYEYLAASILCNTFTTVYLHQEMSLGSWIKSILGFAAAPYSWYINMYIGLFLLIPFLNLIYNNLKDRSQKNILILTFLVTTALPPLVNIKMNLIPNFWTILYPITYYFIGVYIFEYKIKINKIIGLLGIIVISLIEATITFVSSNSIGKGYNWIMDGYGGLLTVILSVLIFLELYTFNISNKMIKRFIESVSKCSLSIYLLSWIFDTVVYKVLNEKIATVPEKLPYYFVAVPLVFVSSYFVAFLVNWSYEFLSRIYKLYKKRKNSIA